MTNNQKDTYAVEVGERLAAARRSIAPALTQARAAEQASAILGKSITSTALANYEQGSRLPSPMIVDALCRVYGNTTASYILGLSDAPQSMRELRMLEKYRLADDRGKYAIDSVAESQSAYDGRSRIADGQGG